MYAFADRSKQYYGGNTYRNTKHGKKAAQAMCYQGGTGKV
jgi:hypothetical protein